MFLRALGENRTTTRRRRRRRIGRRVATGLCAVALAGLAACGGGEERQDADEPEGDYPVDVVTAKFPDRQRLADTTNLRLGVENTGDETVPDLAVTIFVDAEASGSFDIRLEQRDLADPNRPVWVLEDKYPRLAGEPRPKGSSPAEVAQTNTFAFGPLEPGERREMVWKVTPVRGGRYTVSYEIAAGLDGKARAVTADGSKVDGELPVRISTKPPRARVNEQGEIEIQQ